VEGAEYDPCLGVGLPDLARLHGAHWNFDDFQSSTLNQINWFNHPRIRQAMGNAELAELESAYSRRLSSDRGGLEQLVKEGRLLVEAVNHGTHCRLR
jgi:hypothetical protein